MIVIVIGMPGSGKDVFVQVAEERGFSKIGMGDVVRRFASQSGLGFDDASIGGFASSQRDEHGPAVWAERTLALMPTGNAIIDGSRSMDEIRFFRERLGAGLKVVAVTAPAELRYERLKGRRRQDDPMGREDFDRRDARELSWGLATAIECADITIMNDGTLEKFRERCQAALTNMLE